MSKNINELTNCPNCNASWKEKDIYESMLEQNGGNPEEARKSAAFYGWSEENKMFFSRVIGIYDDDRDMTVAWQCPFCKKRWDRFTNKQI